jgi:hypothetical protein
VRAGRPNHTEGCPKDSSFSSLRGRTSVTLHFHGRVILEQTRPVNHSPYCLHSAVQEIRKSTCKKPTGTKHDKALQESSLFRRSCGKFTDFPGDQPSTQSRELAPKPVVVLTSEPETGKQAGISEVFPLRALSPGLPEKVFQDP